jgi:hypothetical protein
MDKFNDFDDAKITKLTLLDNFVQPYFSFVYLLLLIFIFVVD